MEPLANLKVIEMGQLIAGPFAAKTLGDFGADVIKIEAPIVGDALRKWRLLKDGTSVWWQVQSRNKRSLSLDLKLLEAQEIVRALIQEADILIENFRPGTLESWGLDPNDLLKINPKLIVLRISGYGQTGPYRDKPGFGVVAEAMGGLRHLKLHVLQEHYYHRGEQRSALLPLRQGAQELAQCHLQQRHMQ
jgi:formyl-CoA transferase